MSKSNVTEELIALDVKASKEFMDIVIRNATTVVQSKYYKLRYEGLDHASALAEAVKYLLREVL